MTTTVILGLIAILLVIGFVRSSKEKSQEQLEETQTEKESEAPYQTTQEMDDSYYKETFVTEAPKEGEKVEKEIPASETRKAAPVKKTSPKKETTKKTTAKKSPAKKSPAKKTTPKKSAE